MAAPTDPHVDLTTDWQDVSNCGARRTIGMYANDGGTTRVVIDVADDTDPEGYATLMDADGKLVELVGLRATRDVVSAAHVMRYRVLSGSTDVTVWVDGEEVLKGDEGDQGPQADFLQAIEKSMAADSLAADTIAETHMGTIIADGFVDPWVSSRGTLTAHDTNYGSIVIKLYHEGSAVKTWTLTTKTDGAGGLDDWATGSSFQGNDPEACVFGDYLTYAQTKAAAGVAMPARSYGAMVTLEA